MGGTIARISYPDRSKRQYSDASSAFGIVTEVKGSECTIGHHSGLASAVHAVAGIYPLVDIMPPPIYVNIEYHPVIGCRLPVTRTAQCSD